MPKNSKKSGEVKPLGDRVLIEKIETQNETESGIILPEGDNEDKGMSEGKVLEVGEGKMVGGKLQSITSVKKGDRVLFGWGDEIKVNGKKYFLVKEGDISAIIN